MSLNEIAAVTGGALIGPDVPVTGPVVTDSRAVEPGGLYVARVGEHADGHVYAPAAARAGAVGCLGTRAVDDLPTVVVPDVQQAFADLARAVVDRAPDLQIVGITGSSGKTSTKDLLGHVLTGHGPTISPVGSLNSEVGVPLTVCRVTPQTRYLVAEMGADGVGHIAYLTRIAPPRIGIVLNVGSAHLGSFGSVEAIARTKGELVEALPDDGLAILNADDHRVRAMATRTGARVVTVGRAADADVRVSNVELDPLGRPSYDLEVEGATVRVRLGLFGEHQVGNSASVFLAARELGVPTAHVLEAFASARPLSRWRMEVHELPGHRTLVNDAYNANPDSMHAALRTLAHLGRERRTVAVLGQMLELGEESPARHREVGEAAAAEGIDVLVAVGDGTGPIADAAEAGGVRVHRVADVDEAHDLLARLGEDGDVWLFKSSRDSGLRHLGDRIATEAGVEVPA